MLTLPKPWAERAAEDAALLSSIPDELPQQPRQAVNALSGLIASLEPRTAHCDKHGLTYESKGVRVGKRERWSGCPVCQQEAEAAEQAKRDAEAAAARLERLERVMRRTALPERLVERSFDNYLAESPEQQHALDTVRAFARDFDRARRTGASLILAGGTGTGKSHLAAAAIQAILPRYVGMYGTAAGLVRKVRNTWRRDSERSEDDVLAELIAVDLLCIDEIGVQRGTDDERNTLFEIIDGRYLRRRPTILMTNLGSTDFGQLMGDRIASRLREFATWVPFTWADFRKRARKVHEQ